MSRLYLRKGEVGSSFAVSTWQSVMFSEFEAQMSSEARPLAGRDPGTDRSPDVAR
jgi:hypothetical protein